MQEAEGRPKPRRRNHEPCSSAFIHRSRTRQRFRRWQRKLSPATPATSHRRSPPADGWRSPGCAARRRDRAPPGTSPIARSSRCSNRKLPGVQRVVLVADQDRDDRRLAAEHDQAQVARRRASAGCRLRCSRPRISSYSGELRMSQTVQIASRYGGGTGPPKMKVFERILSSSLNSLGAADEAAEAGEALRQRADDQRVVVVAQRVEHGAAALPAQDAGAVGVIDIEDGVAAQADLVQLGQRRQGAASCCRRRRWRRRRRDSRRPRRAPARGRPDRSG